MFNREDPSEVEDWPRRQHRCCRMGCVVVTTSKSRPSYMITTEKSQLTQTHRKPRMDSCQPRGDHLERSHPPSSTTLSRRPSCTQTNSPLKFHKQLLFVKKKIRFDSNIFFFKKNSQRLLFSFSLLEVYSCFNLMYCVTGWRRRFCCGKSTVT